MKQYYAHIFETTVVVCAKMNKTMIKQYERQYGKLLRVELDSYC